MIFSLGFSPWWPSYYPDDYYYDNGFPNDGYGSSTYGYDYPYSQNYDPGDYNSGDYQGQMYYDQNSYPDQSQGYYRGETDGVLSGEMQKAIRRYQSTNGLRQTGDLDSDTLAVMGLSKGTSY